MTLIGRQLDGQQPIGGLLIQGKDGNGVVQDVLVGTDGTIQVSGGGGGTEYIVNDAVPANPTGTTVVAERDDQLSTLSEAEGDWTNARASSKGALWVTIPDTNGDPITSFGGGTQYTEDAASVADPIGTQLIARRRDSLSVETGTDGDNTAVNSTSKGELYVKHVDDVFVQGISSVPVVSAAVTLPVAIIDGSGNQITSFGGGTQYTEGDTDASITGTAMMMEGAGNALVAAQGTAADGLLVNLGSNNDVTQSGTWTVQPGDTANTTPWLTSSKTALTASSPTAATVGTSSAQAVASNANRKGLILTNTSSNTISFGIGAAAVLNSGITLTAGGVWVMDEFTFATGAINAIASAAASNLSIQELT